MSSNSHLCMIMKAGREKPIIGITTGDINGVGPELIVKTLVDNRITKFCTPVIYGSARVVLKYKKILESEEFNFLQIKSMQEINPKKINLINCWQEDIEVNPGKPTAESGKYAWISLKMAVDHLKQQLIDGLVTAPLAKSAMQQEGESFPGHTEYIAQAVGAKDYLMLLVSEKLKVGLVTGHIPLFKVKDTLSTELLLTKFNVLESSLKKDFGIVKPKIAILGLNPHAGEDGLLGEEEKLIIQPVMEQLKNKGKLAWGPFSADGFFGAGHYTKFDAVLAMYHDQGLIPFKTLAFESGVNYTAGLPVVRTSPDHGTAYSLAGKGTVDESSFREAIFKACAITKNRSNSTI